MQAKEVDEFESCIKTLFVFPINEKNGRLMLDAKVNDHPNRMQVDTEAMSSVAFAAVWEYIGKPRLVVAPRLRSYGGESVPTIGQCEVNVEYKGST